jgi:hypothetical protein
MSGTPTPWSNPELYIDTTCPHCGYCRHCGRGLAAQPPSTALPQKNLWPDGWILQPRWHGIVGEAVQ